MRQVSERAKKAIKAFWIIFGIGILSIILMFILINLGVIGHLPPIEELQNPKNKFASEVYSADGEVLGRFLKAKKIEFICHTRRFLPI
jgi:penicillin-binding protein 1A